MESESDSHLDQNVFLQTEFDLSDSVNKVYRWMHVFFLAWYSFQTRKKEFLSEIVVSLSNTFVVI